MILQLTQKHRLFNSYCNRNRNHNHMTNKCMQSNACHQSITTTTTTDILKYITCRSIGDCYTQSSVSQDYGIKQLMNGEHLSEHHFQLDRLNKVFSSQWLNDNQIVFGTKCNKLVVMDTKNEKKHLIPTLKSSLIDKALDNMCGIHSIQINASKTLLATGGHNANEIGVYSLPTLDPVCVGHSAHSDWIFDMTWLDDQLLVSGSRDTTIALWKVNDMIDMNDNFVNNSDNELCVVPKYDHITPLTVKQCRNAEKIRALLYNSQLDDIIVLSLNSTLHRFKAHNLKQHYSLNLKCSQENVCLAQQMDRNLVAIGSKSNITLLDSRDNSYMAIIPSVYQGCGIRSLSFCNDLLTIGTGVGVLLFYDIRANKYINLNRLNRCQTTRPNNNRFAVLKATKGWVYPSDIFNDIYGLMNLDYSPAIYTHQYDTSRTRIFTAGGPLPAQLHGNYAALWK